MILVGQKPTTVLGDEWITSMIHGKRPNAKEDHAVRPSQRRICGLSAAFFWLLMLVMTVILAAGIGGVGGGLASRNKA